MLRTGVLAAVSLVLVVQTPALAAVRPPSPLAEVRTTIDQVIAVLNDRAFEAPGREAERRQALLRVIEPRFDLAETARQALGRHWRERTPAEQEQFVGLFGQLLERAYARRIEAYAGQRIVYLGGRVDGEYATVRTKIVTERDGDISADYRLLRQGDRWLVYDVLIDNVGLVENYRDQFDDVLASFSYADLVKKIEARIHDLDGKAVARADRSSRPL